MTDDTATPDDTATSKKREPCIRFREETSVSLPGGPRTATSDATHRDKRQHYGFCIRVYPDDIEVWFWITSGDCHRMRESTPEARGARVMDALADRLQEKGESELQSRNNFQVCVADDGKPTVNLYNPAL